MICIASPVRRSGTTLLQRLLSSGSNGIVYGETCANDINLFVNLLASKQMMAAQGGQWHDDQLNGVLSGNVNNWIPDLSPETEAYLEAFKNQVKNYLNFFSDYSASKNRPIWGVKLPEWNPSALQMILNNFPKTKIIYLNRNIEDCIPSAEKMGMLQSQNEIDLFRDIHKRYLDYAKTNLIGKNVLHIEYDELVSSPEATIATISNFTGILNIDLEVMHVRIGDYKENA